MVLPRLEQPVVHRQIHIHDQDVGHRRRPLALAEGLGHRIGVGRPAPVEQEPQRLVHAALPLLRRQVEDRQVVLGHAAGPPVLQQVVGHPESAGREHRVAVAVLLERPGLADQPVDDVAVLDAMLAPASEPRQGVQLPGPVPDVERLGPSVMLSSNLAFSGWEAIFKDAMMTAAAIDRLVHHCVIVELNVPSYRVEQAKKGRPTPSATE
jgi:IstB-like ATP binding protein